MKQCIIVVGQIRSLRSPNMQSKLLESFKYFEGDLFFILENEDIHLDLSKFKAREIVYYPKLKAKSTKRKGSLEFQFYGWYQAYSIIQKYENIDNSKYSLIYKTRPDLFLKNYIPTNLNISKNDLKQKIVYAETIGGYNTDHLDFKAVKDTFNILTRPACEDFLQKCYLHLKKNHSYPKLGNEGVLGYILDKYKVKIQKLYHLLLTSQYPHVLPVSSFTFTATFGYVS